MSSLAFISMIGELSCEHSFSLSLLCLAVILHIRRQFSTFSQSILRASAVDFQCVIWFAFCYPQPTLALFAVMRVCYCPRWGVGKHMSASKLHHRNARRDSDYYPWQKVLSHDFFLAIRAELHTAVMRKLVLNTQQTHTLVSDAGGIWGMNMKNGYEESKVSLTPFEYMTAWHVVDPHKLIVQQKLPYISTLPLTCQGGHEDKLWWLQSLKFWEAIP